MRLRRLAVAVVLASTLCMPVTMRADGTDQIGQARRLLAGASAALRAASGEETRLAALGRAVTAHEAALSVLRQGLRAMAVTERAMISETESEADNLRRLLTAIQSVSRAPDSALLAARGGPLEATRAAMLMAAITPEMNRRVVALKELLAALKALRDRQEQARADTKSALASLQDLRASTNAALGKRDRSALISGSELRYQAGQAAARADDLEGLADELRGAGIQGSVSIARAPLPVAGRVIAGFGEPDPWGRPGHGWSVEAPAFAQVTAPWDATVRFAGPLIDYGQVVVLEPDAGHLVVIAGLAHIDRTAGEAVLAGEKLGDLGGTLPTSEEFLLDQTAGGGQIRQETLYLEIRRSGRPLDPSDWFDVTGSEAIQ